MQMESEFFRIHFTNVLEIGAILLAYLGYRRESRKDSEERIKTRQDQAILHNENQLKLAAILKFNESQDSINKQRDLQINLLSLQTGQLTTLAQGFERRLVMLEERNKHTKL